MNKSEKAENQSADRLTILPFLLWVTLSFILEAILFRFLWNRTQFPGWTFSRDFLSLYLPGLIALFSSFYLFFSYYCSQPLRKYFFELLSFHLFFFLFCIILISHRTTAEYSFFLSAALVLFILTAGIMIGSRIYALLKNADNNEGSRQRFLAFYFYFIFAICIFPVTGGLATDFSTKQPAFISGVRSWLALTLNIFLSYTVFLFLNKKSGENRETAFFCGIINLSTLPLILYGYINSIALFGSAALMTELAFLDNAAKNQMKKTLFYVTGGFFCLLGFMLSFNQLEFSGFGSILLIFSPLLSSHTGLVFMSPVLIFLLPALFVHEEKNPFKPFLIRMTLLISAAAGIHSFLYGSNFAAYWAALLFPLVVLGGGSSLNRFKGSFAAGLIPVLFGGSLFLTVQTLTTSLLQKIPIIDLMNSIKVVEKRAALNISFFLPLGDHSPNHSVAVDIIWILGLIFLIVLLKLHLQNRKKTSSDTGLFGSAFSASLAFLLIIILPFFLLLSNSPRVLIIRPQKPISLSIENPVFHLPDVPEFRIAKIETESYLGYSIAMPQDYTFADLIVETADGDTFQFPLKAGIHSSEWAIDRADVTPYINHRRADIFRSRILRDQDGTFFQGHSYYAEFELPEHRIIKNVLIRRRNLEQEYRKMELTVTQIRFKS